MVRMRRYLALSLVLGLMAVAAMFATTDNASAHRSWCHSKHTCPSDHATYRWQGMLCVAPYSDKRNSSFKRRVRYDGRTYYCKR